MDLAAVIFKILRISVKFIACVELVLSRLRGVYSLLGDCLLWRALSSLHIIVFGRIEALGLLSMAMSLEHGTVLLLTHSLVHHVLRKSKRNLLHKHI